MTRLDLTPWARRELDETQLAKLRACPVEVVSIGHSRGLWHCRLIPAGFAGVGRTAWLAFTAADDARRSAEHRESDNLSSADPDDNLEELLRQSLAAVQAMKGSAP